MVRRSSKSKAARRRNNMRKKNWRDQDRSGDSEEMINEVDDDGCLFMRAFGTAREVINVTRVLSGMPSVLVERDDKRTPLAVEIQGEELLELTETIEQLGPDLKRLCQSKSKSIADKAKHAAAVPVHPTPPGEKITQDTLIPFRSGKAISSNSLHLRASGQAKSVSNYIRVLSGLPEDKSRQAVETLDIEGDHLEELLVCLEKLGSSFKKRPRQSKAETGFGFGSGEPTWGGSCNGRFARRPNPGRPRSQAGNRTSRPRREYRRHRRDSDEDMMGAAVLSLLLGGLFF